MTFTNPSASVFVPDGTPAESAFRRVTHLGIGAHQDDLEIMAFHGILHCYRKPDRWFGAVIGTSGSGSPRSGPYASYSDEEMAALRRREQEQAAIVGDYGVLVQLNLASAVVKDPGHPGLSRDLDLVLTTCRPEVVYTHNPADKHDTHVAVGLAVLDSLRRLPAERRPRRVLGCEVWRDLDWLDDKDKIPLDVGGREHLSAGLLAVYDSQIAGGKRYDLATTGRRRANASYFESHGTDVYDELWFAMDLTPVVAEPTRDIADYVLGFIDAFRADVAARIKARARTR
ncbi:MAG: PIG-L family deacetylase [Candidatus Aminicenantes bacterium]|nr:PIG-L family deacetylase [Candidatus Aminicenantes bacterium]